MILATASAVIRHVWTEPKFVAQVHWARDQPSLFEQIMAQVGRSAVEQYAAGGDWPNPDTLVHVEVRKEPDWDWWEPRHDQPWRRQQARDRALDALCVSASS